MPQLRKEDAARLVHGIHDLASKQPAGLPCTAQACWDTCAVTQHSDSAVGLGEIAG